MSTATEQPEELRLGSILRLGWWLALLGIVAGVAGGLIFLGLRPERFGSTVEVLAKPLARDPLNVIGRPSDHVSLDTEARTVTSDAVLRRTSASLPDTPSISELRESVSVGGVPGSNVLQITVVSDAGPTSRARATAVADAYLAERAENARRANIAERPGMEQQLRDAARSLDDVTRARAALAPDSPNHISLANEERLITSRITNLQTRLDQIDRFVPDPGFVQREPTVPEVQGPPPGLLVLGAALVGLVAGLAAATVRAHRG